MNTLTKLIIKCITGLVFSIFILLPPSQAAVDEQNPILYWQKIDRFSELTQNKLDQFLEHLTSETPSILSDDRTNAENAIMDQKQTLIERINELKDLYRIVFIEKNASKEERRSLVFKESNLSIAVHRQLTLLRNYILATETTKVAMTKNLRKMLTEFNFITNSLRQSDSIPLPAEMAMTEVFQVGQNKLSSICKYIGGLCGGASFSKFLDSLDERNFLRENSRFELKNTESMKAVLAQEPKAVFILIGNHDQPLMDIVLGRRVAVELGSQTHVTLTRKSVYPVPPSSKHGDVVFVVDDDPKANPIAESVHLLSKHISKPENKLVSLSVFPEGMLPYTGGQMPMTVKEGAFVIARRLAVHLQTEGIPVFLVQFQSNILEHLTIEQSIPATANLEFIERVPIEPMEKGRPDRWVELRRLGAENSFNQGRAVSQIDLFNSRNPSGSQVPLRASIHKCRSALR